MIALEDHYFKNIVEFRPPGLVLRFRVSQSLFSSHEVDAGTRMLLATLRGAEVAGDAHMLDLGCGYGAAGITLAAASPGRELHMVDRDALAVSYARQNALLNGIAYAEVHGSLGYDDVRDERFDLIAANIPGKAGAPVIEHLLLGAEPHLTERGFVAAVVVAPLAPAVHGLLTGSCHIELLREVQKRGHAVFHYRFDGSPNGALPQNAFAAGVYDRDSTIIDTPAGQRELRTVSGLPEFDTPSFATQLLMRQLNECFTAAEAGSHVAVFRPGQGHVAVLADALFRPRRLSLIDRDLLSLRATARNIARNRSPDDDRSVEAEHRVGLAALDQPADLITGTVAEDEPVDATAANILTAIRSLRDDGSIVVAATSTAAARVTKRMKLGPRWLLVERRRKRGSVILEIARRR